MAGTRRPGTKWPTKCPFLPVFQAASPILEAGEQENGGDGPCDQGAFLPAHQRGKTNPHERSENKTGSDQTLKWCAQQVARDCELREGGCHCGPEKSGRTSWRKRRDVDQLPEGRNACE